MSDISLSKAVRSNLLSLKGTADMMASTQNRLATGNKVNSALDNPSSWFTAKGLTNRASDLGSLIDSMANGVKTLEAADNGLSAMTKTLESMQSTLRQARQDKSFQTASYALKTTATAVTDDIEFTGGAVGTTAVKVNLGSTTKTTTGFNDAAAAAANTAGETFTIAHNGVTTGNIAVGTTVDATVTAINAAISAANTASTTTKSDIVATNENGQIKLTSAKGGAITTADTGGTGTTPAFGTDVITAKSVDTLVSEINDNTSLTGKIRASNDNGKLRIENQSTQELTVTGYNTASSLLEGGTTTAKIAGNSVRAGLASQFNELRDQLDKLADDASFNGINLLRGDKLAITFNETGTSSIDIQTKNGDTVNSANLGVSTTLEEQDLDSDTNIDTELAKLKSALNEVRSQASTFGSNLSIVENRQTFTKAMINTLEDGAGNLTLADMNTEAANLLALQTRQSLSQNSLSLASQADQSILQLIR
jgi:flagellin